MIARISVFYKFLFFYLGSIENNFELSMLQNMNHFYLKTLKLKNNDTLKHRLVCSYIILASVIFLFWYLNTLNVFQFQNLKLKSCTTCLVLIALYYYTIIFKHNKDFKKTIYIELKVLVNLYSFLLPQTSRNVL